MKKISRSLVLSSAIFFALGGIVFYCLRNSTAWTMLTLFNPETRAENFRNFHTIFTSEAVNPGDSVWHFQSDLRPLPEFFTFEGQQRRIDVFLAETSTTGFAVARNGELLYEAYSGGYGTDSLPTSFSVAKSFVSALVGIAIEDGYIASVWDPVESYVPALANSEYGPIPLHHLLTMSSGMVFDEDYANPRSDINMLPLRVFIFRTNLLDLLADIERLREPGTHETIEVFRTIARWAATQ